MNKEYYVGYIFEESELPSVAEYCNSQGILMTDSYDVISKEINEDGEIKKVGIRRFQIKEIPIDILKEQKRNKRNIYLEKYVDPIVTNILRWNELTKEEQQNYIEYRKYLLDFTKQEDWWKKVILTFDDWKK